MLQTVQAIVRLTVESYHCPRLTLRKHGAATHTSPAGCLSTFGISTCLRVILMTQIKYQPQLPAASVAVLGWSCNHSLLTTRRLSRATYLSVCPPAEYIKCQSIYTAKHNTTCRKKYSQTKLQITKNTLFKTSHKC